MLQHTSLEFMKEMSDQILTLKMVDNNFLRTSQDEMKKLMDERMYEQKKILIREIGEVQHQVSSNHLKTQSLEDGIS